MEPREYELLTPYSLAGTYKNHSAARSIIIFYSNFKTNRWWILTWNFDPPVFAHPIVITECVPFVVVPDLELDNKKNVML